MVVYNVWFVGLVMDQDGHWAVQFMTIVCVALGSLLCLFRTIMCYVTFASSNYQEYSEDSVELIDKSH